MTRISRGALPRSAALLLFVLPARASAAELPDDRDHALPCRPTVACTADIVAPGMFELESGVQIAGTSAMHQSTTPILFKQTLTTALQLQAGSNGFTLIRGATRAEYLDDAILGAKVHLHDQGDLWPSLSVMAQASIPTFHEDGYLRTYDTFWSGFVTKDIGFVHADLNGGLNVWRVDGAPLTQPFAALALSMLLPPPFGLAVEGYAWCDAAPVAPRDAGFRIALTASPRPWLVLDLGGDAGFFPSTRAYTVFAGMTIVPVVFWRPPK